MMNIKFSKKIIKNHIRYDWWKYLLTGLLVSLLCYYITYLKNKIQPYERMQVFVTGTIVDKEFINKSYEIINHTDILSMTYYSILSSEANYYSAMQTQGLGGSDIMILPESSFTGAFIPYIAKFDEELINRCKQSYENIEFLNYDNDDPSKICGVKVKSKTSEQYNNDLKITSAIDMELNDNYFIIVPTISCNIGKYGKNPERTLGLNLLDYLLQTNEK